MLSRGDGVSAGLQPQRLLVTKDGKQCGVCGTLSYRGEVFCGGICTVTYGEKETFRFSRPGTQMAKADWKSGMSPFRFGG
jgi:hypothetical protein